MNLQDQLRANAKKLAKGSQTRALLEEAATEIDRLNAKIEQWQDEVYRVRTKREPPGPGD